MQDAAAGELPGSEHRQDGGAGYAPEVGPSSRRAQPATTIPLPPRLLRRVVRPEDIRRFARLGVVASMQATHATSDGPWAERRLGPERVKWSYAWRQFLDAGARFADGSDFPVESPNPTLGLYAAITRCDLAGELPAGGWRPEERLTPGEALKSFTVWGAWLAFRERDLGSLEIGKQADFIVVDRDPVLGARADIPKTRVLRTMVAGETVYEAPAR